jgi:hypothetical protein
LPSPGKPRFDGPYKHLGSALGVHHGIGQKATQCTGCALMLYPTLLLIW